MRYHDMNGGDWFWMGGAMLVLVAAVVAIVIFGFGGRGRGNSTHRSPDEVLHHRLASGEIDIDEFQRRMDALKGARG
ncbi:hypothetical protein BH10ACT2_BH10ACT2_21250 [soil metagenome]